MRRRAIILKVILIGACVCLGALPGLIGAQVTPEAGPVTYGPTITTDRAKLYACYSLVRQMTEEYNRQSTLAAANKEKYDGKFRTYVHDYFDPVLKALLSEQNGLKEKLRTATYSAEDWSQISEMSTEAQRAIYTALYGDRGLESVKATVAIYSDFDDLKLVVLDDLLDSEGFDPTEDYTTYEDVDTGGYLSETADRITATDLPRDAEAYYYYNKGVDHFDGDFEHRQQVYNIDGSGNGARWGVWVLANALDGINPLIVADEDLLYVETYHWLSPENMYMWIAEVVAGEVYTDSTTATELPTDETIWCEYEREETAGPTYTLYGWLCTVNYYGETGSVLEASLSLTLHDEEAFQYIYGANSYDDSGTQTLSAWAQYLDLQEAAPTAAPYSFGYILGASL